MAGKVNPHETSHTTHDEERWESEFEWKIPQFHNMGARGKRHYSSTFMAGGCPWRLSLYPRGNASMKGSRDHVALYLEAADATSAPVGWRRFVEFKLAIVNHKVRIEITHPHRPSPPSAPSFPARIVAFFLGTAGAGGASPRRPARHICGFETQLMAKFHRTYLEMSGSGSSGRTLARSRAIWANPPRRQLQPSSHDGKKLTPRDLLLRPHPPNTGFLKDDLAKRFSRVQWRHQRRHVGLLPIRRHQRRHFKGWRLCGGWHRRRGDHHRGRRREMDAQTR